MDVFDLGLPIVLSGLATHILSTIAWMALPHHNHEVKQLPVEDELQRMLQTAQIPADQYMFPYGSTPQETDGNDAQPKGVKPCGMLILWSKPANMGVAIGQTLAFFLLAAFVIGYLASLALPAGASFGRVMQFVVTAGLLAHCSAKFPHVFWFRRKVAMELVDGVAYALVTGLIFAMLWPAG